MDQKTLREREARCIQGNPPGCITRCPIHVDVRGIVDSIRKGNPAEGFALYHRMVPFPRIISRICDMPCQQGCTRKEIEMPIFISALERFCVNQNHTAIAITVLPRKDKKVAVVGAGLSGLTAAWELGCKGYIVELFEAADRLGGSLWDISEKMLPRQAILDDFSVFAKIPLKIHYDTRIRFLDSLLADFDAVYATIPLEMNEFRLDATAEGGIKVDPVSLATSHKKIFAGGSLRSPIRADSPIALVAEGKKAAISIDRFLQNASLTANRENEGLSNSLLCPSTKGIVPVSMVAAADPVNGYTKEEALQEAGRCLLCECMECVKVCEYLAHFHKFPKQYVREIYNNLSIVMGIHRANKLINSCSLCGLCEQVCPGKLNMGEICHQARQRMVETGKMPPSVYEFALRDMQFSTGDEFLLTRHQPGHTTSRFVFYPGCQLAASAPGHVKDMYLYLCSKLTGGVGLMLGCCGAPADWSGNKALFQETMQAMQDTWRSLGAPKVVTACPTCYSLFKQYVPDMPVETLWTLLDRIGLPDTKTSTSKKLAIHDSCTTRLDAELQESIRHLLEKMGHSFEELSLNRKNTVCCGYGGLMFLTNQEVANKVIDRRIHESEADYVVYCSMCRDNFVGQGKQTYHLLDIIFGSTAANGALHSPGFSERQENKARLKRLLLQEVWGERMEKENNDMKLIISEEVLRIMESRRILIDDVKQVITHAESTGEKMQTAGSGSYIAYFQPANITYWIEYEAKADGFIVRNAYCHRLTIIPENGGRK
jgi:glutamate synthase (NADPH) small chain